MPIDSSNDKGLFKNISDKSIIEGVRNQDDKILNWVYDNYLQSVKNYILKNSGTVEDVPDVFQDSIIILYRQITEEDLNLTTDLKGYFFGVARNVWNAQLRKKQRTIELKTDLSDEDETDELSNLVLESILSRAFQKLRRDQQKILTLFSDGYSYQEIAIKMDLKNEQYARRKKYICKETLLELMKEDPEYQEYLRLLK